MAIPVTRVVMQVKIMLNSKLYLHLQPSKQKVPADIWDENCDWKL